MLPGNSAIFGRTSSSGALRYDLWLGSSRGAGDLYLSYMDTPNVPAFNIPVDGRLIWVRIWTITAATALYNDYAYTALQAAVITSPSPGSSLSGPSVNVTRTNSPGAIRYDLWVGSSPGSLDLYATYVPGTAVTVPNLPTDGRLIYMRLWTVTAGGAGYTEVVVRASLGSQIQGSGPH